MDKIRILSLDGGGARAGIHARTLGRLYGPETPGRDIIRKFDFVAGNSGGSLVLAALCCNYTPQQIAAFYDDPATVRKMFSPRRVAGIRLPRSVRPRYSSEGKLEALKWIFDRTHQDAGKQPSELPLQEWPKRLKSNVNLIVIAFDYDKERATFFRSNPESRAKSRGPVPDPAPTLIDAVHASTSAPYPFYYDKPAKIGDRRYWDGAMGGYNNPVLAAVVEALANRPGEADAIRVLSLGTGTSARPLITDKAGPPLGKDPASTSLCGVVRKAATVILGDPPDIATFHAYVALRQPLPPTESEGNVVRLCPQVKPIWDPDKEKWELPRGLCEADFKEMVHMELDGMSPRELALTRKMCDLWMADQLPNQPIRMGDHLSCDIGHDKFSAAVAHWNCISR